MEHGFLWFALSMCLGSMWMLSPPAGLTSHFFLSTMNTQDRGGGTLIHQMFFIAENGLAGFSDSMQLQPERQFDVHLVTLVQRAGLLLHKTALCITA